MGKGKLSKTKSALVVALLSAAAVLYFVAPYNSNKADSSIAARILQKEKTQRQAVNSIIAGVLGAAEGNDQVMAILAFTNLQAAGSIIESAIKDSKELCSSNEEGCLYALGFVKMTIAIYGVPQSKADEKNLVQSYSTAYSKYAALKGK